MRIICIVATLFVSLSFYTQDRCEESGALKVIVEQAPIPDVPYAEIELRLNQSFSPMDLGLEESDEIEFICVVNCRGESFDHQVSGLKKEVHRQALEQLYKDIGWQPAEDGGVPVDCLNSCTFIIEDDKFVMDMTQKGQLKRKRGR